MQIQLSSDDARAIHSALNAQLVRVEDELVHTDQRDLQKEIADQANRLRELIARLHLVRVPDQPAADPAVEPTSESADHLRNIHDREVVEDRKSSVQLVMLLIAVVFVVVAVVIAR